MFNQKKYNIEYWNKNKDILSLKSRERWKKNKEKYNVQQRKHYTENREELNKKSRTYYKENRGRLLEQKKEYAARKKNDIRIYRRKRYLSRIEYFKEQSCLWRKNNPEQAKIQKQVKRARRRLSGNITTKTVQLVYEDNIKINGTLTCVLCGKPIAFGQDSLEHLLPITRGGTHDYNNLGVAHFSCNSMKRNMTISEWQEYKTSLDKAVY